MKQLFLMAVLMGVTFISSAQVDEKPINKEKIVVEGVPVQPGKQKSQEIIIRKKGDKDTKISVEINGDKVMVNGKPLSEFKDGDVTIHNRNITLWDGKNNLSMAPFESRAFLMDQFKNMGKEESFAFLGVNTNFDNEGNEDNKPNGATITFVTKGTAAEKAGLKEGDIITKINDKPVTDPSSLTEAVRSFKPKEEVTVFYKREGKEKSAKVILGEKKETNSISYSFSSPDAMAKAYVLPKKLQSLKRVSPMPYVQNRGDGLADAPGALGLGGDRGIALYDGLFSRRPKIGLKIQDVEEGTGVKVLDADKDSPAEKAGLKKDDIITEINGKKIDNTDDAREQLNDEGGVKNVYKIKAKRNGSEMNFDVKIPKKLKIANL
jgi:serine protease Do